MFQYNTDFVPQPFGLANYSSICWLNSCIQCLLSLPSLNQYLIANEHKYKEGTFAREYSKFVRSVVVDKNNINNVGPLGMLLVSQATGPHDLINGASCANSAIVAIQDLLNADNIFDVITSSTIICQCRSNSTLREKNNYLRVDFPLNTNDPNVFREILMQQVHRVDYKCNKCGSDKAVRKIDLRRLEKIIVIPFHSKTLMKYSQWFPEFLEFPKPDDGKLTYKLCAIVEHSGGHYWAHINSHNSWYMANDSSCYADMYNCSDTPFILLYNQV